MNFLLHLLLLLVLSALSGALWVAQRPADVPAPSPPAEGARRPRDVLDDLRQAGIKRSSVFEISEADLNLHLSRVLQGATLPPASRWAGFQRIAVSLQPEVLEATLLWHVLDRPRTVTLRFKVVRLDSTFRVTLTGGSYGHLEVPRGLLRPMFPTLDRLSQALSREIQALFQMNQIRITEGRLVIDPRFP